MKNYFRQCMQAVVQEVEAETPSIKNRAHSQAHRMKARLVDWGIATSENMVFATGISGFRTPRIDSICDEHLVFTESKSGFKISVYLINKKLGLTGFWLCDLTYDMKADEVVGKIGVGGITLLSGV